MNSTRRYTPDSTLQSSQASQETSEGATLSCRQFPFPSVPGYNCLVCEPVKFFSSRLRGWFGSLVAVQGDLPVMTAESRHWFLTSGEPVLELIIQRPKLLLYKNFLIFMPPKSPELL